MSPPPIKVLAIRREDYSVWERRAPLAPDHVRQLVKDGVKVIVQPSSRRAYPVQAYMQAGAIIREDLSEASLVLGVKPVPVDLLEPSKTYAFFSHTIKAQEANMPLLDSIIEKNIRLIDYELIDSKRGPPAAFGKMAGVAGIINILHGLGMRLLALGDHTPFMHIGPAHSYRNLSLAKQAVRDAGYEIALGMMPKSVGPLTFVFTGTGNVSMGAQEIIREMPHIYVKPDDLQEVSMHGDTDKVYVCVIGKSCHAVRKTDGGFDCAEYTQHPERYDSTFSKKYAPYSSVIVNGIVWTPGAPRFITMTEARSLLAPRPAVTTNPDCPELTNRLLAICDVSADPGGSIEFMKDCTTIDKPFVVYNAEQDTISDSLLAEGVLICSVDILPAELPLESTDLFGTRLLPYIHDMLKSDATTPFDEFDSGQILKNAVIASNGNLTPDFEYIDTLRRNKRQ